MQTPRSASLFNIKGLYFFYFGAFGVFSVFINIYYREIGLSGVEIGSINGIAPLVAIAGGPIWGLLNDRLGRPRTMMMVAALGMVGAVMGISTVRTVVALLPLAGAYSLLNSAMVPMIDTFNLNALGANSELYGKQRIWGTVGYVLVTSGAGVVLERTSVAWMFYIYYVMIIGLVAAAAFLPGRQARPVGAVSLRAGGLRGQRRLLVFLASVALVGTAMNAMNTFLPVYLRDMGASNSLVGLTISLGSLSEMPIMLATAAIMRRMGLKRMLVTAYSLYALRMLLYGLIPSPGWALPIALMHALTFGLYWVSAVVHVNQLAPAGLKNTSQALLFAAVNVANTIGSLAGGWMYDQLGPAGLFRVHALISAVGLVVLLAGWSEAGAESQPETPGVLEEKSS